MTSRSMFRGASPAILLWPLVCLLAVGSLWAFAYWKINSDKSALESRALADTASLSRVYAAYLSHSFDQMDQIAMHVKADWERQQGKMRLEILKRAGLFASSRFVSVAIVNNKGAVVTSTTPFDGGTSFAGHDFFKYHATNNSTALRIGAPVFAGFAQREVIYFTRRLEKENEAFDGVVLIAVDPAHLTSFYDEAIFGKSGLLAVLGEDGMLRSSTIGGKRFGSGQPAVQAVDALNSPHISQALSAGALFSDGLPRYVGRHRLSTYPFVVLAGLSRAELVAPQRSSWQAYRYFAAAGTVGLLLFGLVGAAVSLKLDERERQARAIRHSYRLATNQASDGFFIMNPVLDERGNVVDWILADCNDRGAELFGIKLEAVLGSRLSKVYQGPLFDSTMEVLDVAFASGSYEDEYRVPSGSLLKAAWLHRRMVRSETGLAVTIRDITAVKENEQNLQRLANEDAVTALPNRHWLMRFLPFAMERARFGDQKLAILFVDLDEFKNVNDTLGHSAGDELLRIVASRIREVLRPSDKVVRLGGDEFTIVVEHVAHTDDAAHVAERVGRTLRNPVEIAGTKLAIGASIGISIFPDDGVDAEILLKNADIAMYAVKSDGKGHFRFFEPSLYESLKARLDGEQALRRALDLDQFELVYQPRVETSTCELVGMEALVRWHDPERGVISPMEFIPLAESTGLILQLGQIVIDKVCCQIAAWKAAGLRVVPVSVNVSPRQFNEGDVRGALTAAIIRHGISAAELQIEITESAMMAERSNIRQELAAIRDIGVKILVDDFGTGYSSLAQLQRLDMDALKVDRAFTSELGTSPEGEVFFKAIISMAHALGMTVTAEGVETPHQLETLRFLGCDEVQGYLISRPVSSEETAKILSKRLLAA